MTQYALANSLTALQECVDLAGDLARHAEANEAFSKLRDRLNAENPQAAELLGMLWQEMMSARRSSAFWEQICDVEREMSEQIAASHLQLQQNYLRLVQEQ